MEPWEDLRQRVIARNVRVQERLQLLELLRRDPDGKDKLTEQRKALLDTVKNAAERIGDEAI